MLWYYSRLYAVDYPFLKPTVRSRNKTGNYDHWTSSYFLYLFKDKVTNDRTKLIIITWFITFFLSHRKIARMISLHASSHDEESKEWRYKRNMGARRGAWRGARKGEGCILLSTVYCLALVCRETSKNCLKGEINIQRLNLYQQIALLYIQKNSKRPTLNIFRYGYLLHSHKSWWK